MLRFGTSGVPRSSARPTTEAGVRRARELGLDCLEMAWVNGIRMGEEAAERISRAARECDVDLTAHAPYYVNLCGSAAVVRRSLERLKLTARLGSRCGAKSFCFHAGFYGRTPPEEARQRVEEALGTVCLDLEAERLEIDVRPELTGRRSQLGSLSEVLSWCSRVPGVRPCIDFAHQFARTGGGFNRYSEFTALLVQVRERLGAGSLKRLHIHVSGIEYGAHGEIRHVPLRQSKFRYRELLRALRDLRVSGWVVCESPAREEDALLLQRTYRRL
jgi:deoxyribonuclease-4